MAQETFERLRLIDPEILTDVVRQDMQSSSFEITAWQVEPLGHVIMNQATVGQLVAISLFFFEREPHEAEALYNNSFEAYQAGLEEAGWGSQTEAVRLASLISVALWPGLVLPSFTYWYTVPGYYKETAIAQFGRSEDEMVSGWVALSEFSLQCAAQVRQKLDKRGW